MRTECTVHGARRASGHSTTIEFQKLFAKSKKKKQVIVTSVGVPLRLTYSVHTRAFHSIKLQIRVGYSGAHLVWWLTRPVSDEPCSTCSRGHVCIFNFLLFFFCRLSLSGSTQIANVVCVGWCPSTNQNMHTQKKSATELSHEITKCVCWKIGRKIESNETESKFLAFRSATRNVCSSAELWVEDEWILVAIFICHECQWTPNAILFTRNHNLSLSHFIRMNMWRVLPAAAYKCMQMQ